uniref:Uncharacterized protein n=1 Tax=Rhizophora mucronata TaxID=61149 RepID=A0A2P2NS21_RHIMU
MYVELKKKQSKSHCLAFTLNDFSYCLGLILNYPLILL